MYFKQVAEFIKENHDTFDQMEEDLAQIAKSNKNYTSTLQKRRKDGDYTAEKNGKVKFRRGVKNRYEAEDYDIFFNGKKTTMSIDAVFYDFVMNYYKTVSKGKKFVLSENALDEWETYKVEDETEKLIHLSTIFRMLFDARYLSSLDMESLNRFICNERLWFVVFYKPSWDKLEQQDLEISGKTTRSYNFYVEDMIKDGKKYCFNGARLVSDVYREKMYRERSKGSWNDCRSDMYNSFKKEFVLKEVLPKNTLKKIEEHVGIRGAIDIPYGLDNSFAIRAFEGNLPEKLTLNDYNKIRTGILQEKKNSNKIKNHKMFYFLYALIKKYSYKKIKYMNVAKKGEMNGDFEYLKNLETAKLDYDKFLELPNSCIRDFIEYQFKTKKDYTDKRLNIMFALYLISKRHEEEILTGLSDDFWFFLKNISETYPDKKEVLDCADMFREEYIVNGEFYEKLSPILSMYFYREDSESYVMLTKDMREEMGRDYLKLYIKKNTVYKNAKKHNPNNEVEEGDYNKKLHDDLLSIFAMDEKLNIKKQGVIA